MMEARYNRFLVLVIVLVRYQEGNPDMTKNMAQIMDNVLDFQASYFVQGEVC